MTRKYYEGINYPDGWSGSSDEQREHWAAEAESLLAEHGRVPPHTLQAFAVAWDYARRNKWKPGGKTADDNPESAEADT